MSDRFKGRGSDPSGSGTDADVCALLRAGTDERRDNPPIGIVLCADKSESVVKYTLPENETQIFASKYKLYLPSEEELIQELNQEYQALEAGKAAEEK